MDERKLVKRLRLLFVKIPFVLWIVSIIAVFLIYPLSGVFFTLVSAVIMMPWLLFFNRFIK